MLTELDPVRLGLLNSNILFLVDDVAGPMVEQVYTSLAILEGRGSPDVEIRISTNGGNVRAGLDIYDALKRYSGNKAGIVYAYARSMGAIILQACNKRVCLQHARVLIHHVNTESVSLDELDDPEKLQELHTSMRQDQTALYEILKRTGKSEDEIRSVCRKDQDMTASEALAFGLIDSIE